MPIESSPPTPATVPGAFAAALAYGDPARPLLTWYDDATGDRAELSGATLANWVAKTANLLVEGCGLDHGEVAWVDAPPHWQTAAVLLGCWCAGLAVGAGEPQVVFAAADLAAAHTGTGAEVYGLALAPMAAPMREAPPGVADYVTEVRVHGDQFRPATPVAPEEPATTVSHADLCMAAAVRAGELGIGAGDRVLIVAEAHPEPLDWLLAPLVAGATVVLCANPDPAALAGRATTEHVTVHLPPTR